MAATDPLYYAPNTVAIVGPDGFAKSKATFTPMAPINVGNAAPLVAPPAVVADGAVYFVDHVGTVRRLAVGADVSQVTVFPITGPQQELSLAVSPDGKHLVAAVLTLPDIHWPPPPSGALSPPAGSWVLEVQVADAGGSARVLHRWESPGDQPQTFQMIRFVGWDATGPVAIIDSALGTQNALFAGQTLFGGHFAHVDASTGIPTAEVLGNCQGFIPGGPSTDKQPWSVAADGTVLCASQSGAVVSGADGTPQWSFQHHAGDQFYGDFALAPDHRHLALTGLVASPSASSALLPVGFEPAGWLDSGTVMGSLAAQGNSTCREAHRLALVRLSQMDHVDDLGFCATYLAPLTSG